MKSTNVKSTSEKSIFLAFCLFLILPFSSSYAQSGHQHNSKEHKGHTINETNGGAQFKDEKTAAIYNHYQHIKSALVASDASEAQQGAKMLLTSLKEVGNTTKAQNETEKIIQATALEKQREAFVLLSEAMTELVKGSISSGELYNAYCPMANNNKGAFWLASEKEIKNPYFGDKMLNCGSVRETIAQ